MAADFEKIASVLAEHAVRVKQADNPLLSNEALGTGLAGAGVGALLGMTSRKNKLRNAMMYGLGGGLAGMGAGVAMRSSNQQAAAQQQALQEKAREAARLSAPPPPTASAIHSDNGWQWNDLWRVMNRYYNPVTSDNSGQYSNDRPPDPYWGAGDDVMKNVSRGAAGVGGVALGGLAGIAAGPAAAAGVLGRGLVGGGIYGAGSRIAEGLAAGKK